MRAPEEWGDIDVDGDPVLVVGWRPKPRRLQAAAVAVGIEAFSTMRELARETLAALTARVREEWHPDAHVEPGEEYLALDVTDLPSTPSRPEPTDSEGREPPDDPQLAEAAEFLRIVLRPGDLGEVEPSELSERRFNFYALVWEDGNDGNPVAFADQYDPTSVFRNASRWFRDAGTLQPAETPAMALPFRAGLVVTHDELAVLNATSFERLFSDVRALLNDVPASAGALAAALPHLALSDGSRAAFAQVCSARPRLALRLQRLPLNPALDAMTPDRLHAVLPTRGLDPDDFLDGDELDIGAEQVRAFLDLAEQRWYDADFTGDPRRAGTWTARRA